MATSDVGKIRDREQCMLLILLILGTLAKCESNLVLTV